MSTSPAYLLDTNILSDLVRHPQGTVAARITAVGEEREGRWVGTNVYTAKTAPFTGDLCEWKIEGQINAAGSFSFTSTLIRATGVGVGFCISSTGGGQAGVWQRSGNAVTFRIASSSAYLIGNITQHTGTILDNGRRVSVSGSGVEQGVAFDVSMNLYKM